MIADKVHNTKLSWTRTTVLSSWCNHHYLSSLRHLPWWRRPLTSGAWKFGRSSGPSEETQSEIHQESCWIKTRCLNEFLLMSFRSSTLLTNICCNFLFFLGKTPQPRNPETPKHHRSGSNRKDRSHACYAHNTSVSSQYSNPLGVNNAGPSKDHEGSKGHEGSLFTIGPFRMPKPTNTPDISLRNPPNILLAEKTTSWHNVCFKTLLHQTAEGNGASASKQENWCSILLPRKLTCPLKSMLGFNEFPFDMVPFLGDLLIFLRG